MPTNTPKTRRVLGPCSHIFVAANTGSWRIERPEVDANVCVRCGICASYCPCAAIDVIKEGDTALEIDMKYCKGCGICANECPKHAISMVPEGGAK